MNQYKYISKPYTLDELVNGNPIFKIYCDFFNDIYEWEQEQDDSIDSDFVNIKHLELLFNEFLNILSLLHYDKLSYNNTFKHITLKLKEIENLSYLVNVIPYMLENCYFFSDPEMAEKVEKFNLKTNYYKIDNNKSNSEMDVEDSLFKIAKKHSENLENVLIEKNVHDLNNFFDKYYEKLTNDYTKVFTLKGKREDKNIHNFEKSQEKIKSLDTSQQVLLLEEILVLGKKWEELNPTSKSNILCHLFGKNKDNIRDVYYEINKPKSTYSKKILSDMKNADDLIKKITG